MIKFQMFILLAILNPYIIEQKIVWKKICAVVFFCSHPRPCIITYIILTEIFGSLYQMTKNDIKLRLKPTVFYSTYTPP